MTTAIVKLGSSLKDDASILDAIHEVYGFLRHHHKVLVTISENKEMTSHLLKYAKKVATDATLNLANKENADIFNHILHSVGIPVGQSVLVTNGSIETSLKKWLHQKKKVLLLGLGTVGLGVYEHLKTAHHLFDIVGVGVKHLAKHAYLNIPKNIISDDLENLIERDFDILIELIGDPVKAEQCIAKALQQKKDVITANKLLMAEKGLGLTQLAKTNHVKLLYSAAVGGSLPILENIDYFLKNSSDEIQSVTGILNGTCNYILDLLSKGKKFEEALKEAQKEGYAEQDPSLDIQGIDAAHKLKIIARTAFGRELSDFSIEGIEKVSANGIVKLIAHCELKQASLYASVKPESVPVWHPFAAVKGADNCIIIKTRQGKAFRLEGKGAGRWPTALSVYADVLNVLPEVSHQSQNDDTLTKKIRENAS